MITWTWEYFDGQYIVRRVDRTEQVAIMAPHTVSNNVAASALCDFIDREALDAKRLAAQFAHALRMEQVYHSNNTGENAARRKTALAALPKGWKKYAT